MDTVQGSLERELPTRISARGVIAGMLVGLALAAMLMALGNAIGVTALSREGSPRLMGVGFAGWFVLSFAVGAFAGGWLAAGAARALRRRDGVLHGIVSWAALALISSSLVRGVMHGVTASMLGDRLLVAVGAWGTFAAMLVPLLAAVAGGIVGAARERRVAGLVDERTARRRRPIVTSPQHTGEVPVRPPLPQT
ncbi:MAG: hypothetical protein JWM53_4341 [bacterium]|nr:hypothetical protein [bacterium]